MFVHTTAIKKLRKLKARVRVVPGGTSAGKTYGIIPILIDTAIKTPKAEISIVSESIPHLRRGALRDFIKIMKDTNRWVEANYNRTFLIYTFSNGAWIEFFSAEDEDKVRGARRDILYINECNNTRFNTYHQLAIRTKEIIWLDFNPDNEFWVHTELADDPDAEWLTLTFYDNEALAESIRKEILKAKEKAKTSAYWANWWKVYGLGLLGKLEGVIFDNWAPIDEIPKEARLIGYTIDFGFTNDPTTLTGAWDWEDTVVWDEMIYETGMTNGDIAKRMKRLGVRTGNYVVADSAEPKSIKEINEYGFKVRPAVKGRDSIRFGIDTLQENDFRVTERSVNLIKELRQYAWATDKTGKSLNVPIDAFNHCIDGMRYLATGKISRQKKKRKGPRRRN